MPRVASPPDIIEFIKSEEYLGPNDKISVSQVATLKSIYGLTMTSEELDAFLEMSDGVKPRKGGYPEAVLVIGQRAGKTNEIIANVAVYDGFTADLSFLSPGEDAYFPIVAQDTDRAMQARGYIEGKLLLLEERGWEILDHGVAQSRAITGKQVRCKKRDQNGAVHSLIYQCFPCTKASTRGITAIGWAGDETAWWRTDEGAYNPDVEIIRALKGRVATVPFRTHGIIGSSPYGEEGVLWDRYQKRFKLRNTIVLNAPSWVFNPNINKQVLADAQEDDPVAFQRDYGGQFGKAGGTYLSADDIEKCVDKDRPDIIPPQPGVYYQAALDVAFKHDLYVWGIGHNEGEVAVIDLIQAKQGSRKVPLVSEECALEAAEDLKRYGVDTIVADQYCDLEVVKDFDKAGIRAIIEPQSEDYNFDMFKNLKAAVRRRLVNLPDLAIVKKDLLSLRSYKTTRRFRIMAPDKKGFHDDISKVIAVLLMKILPISSGLDTTEVNERAMVSEQPSEFTGDLMEAIY